MHNDKPSSTALLILKSIVFLSFDPRFQALIPPEMARLSAQLLEASSTNGKRFIEKCRSKRFATLLWAIERCVLPGILLHYVLRKRCLEETAIQAIEKGALQLIVLAAGFDLLCYRLAGRFPEVIFIEIDHPATQEVKRKAFARNGWEAPNLILLASDLTAHDLTDRLLSSGRFDRGQKSLFIAEGITMYLKEADIFRLFTVIRELSAPDSSFAFTFMEKQQGGSIHFKESGLLLKFWLALKKENFIWGIEKQNLEPLLRRHGFQLKEILCHDALERAYLKDAAVLSSAAAGECVGVADVAA